jgi:hypothetical protein
VVLRMMRVCVAVWMRACEQHINSEHLSRGVCRGRGRVCTRSHGCAATWAGSQLRRFDQKRLVTRDFFCVIGKRVAVERLLLLPSPTTLYPPYSNTIIFTTSLPVLFAHWFLHLCSSARSLPAKKRCGGPIFLFGLQLLLAGTMMFTGPYNH